ncbi:A/G-specific adenine glycosylase [Halovulum dunhuangense]|uniref:Adenine DNA glycosylase n=1 Tax=Halovulum dunhuangense TaxID=1505036 RepID=A0A849KQI1_9RHOB|nr:A/G-specific adenine glycosylase [Halovulum dunhuangense]NNU79109.1 A/G-specific adenine glycosylase [Halovulum dunhuangense]
MRDLDPAPETAGMLLEWYDRNARDLPWRVPPHRSRAGFRADPYHVWLSEVMLQQTTVAAVGPYFHKFTTLWPSVSHLAAAEDADVMAAWAGLGYYARARNLLKCARQVAGELDGCFPDTEAGLATLPGIGPYTAAAIAAIAFDRPAVVVDGNVERVMARLFDIRTPLPAAKPEIKAAAAALTPAERPGDHAQAVMDLGATICTPRNPACGICPLMAGCLARRNGSAADLPAKTPKAAKPVRRGVAYLARRADGAILLERRPDKGLLGGMLGLPGPDWGETVPAHRPPVDAEWRISPLVVRHTFTHFHLELEVRVTELPEGAQARSGRFHPGAELRAGDLPTVFRKALKAGLAGLDD